VTDRPSLRARGQLRPLDRSILLAEAPAAAERVLGLVLTSSIGDATVSVRIVETEAYRQDDPASHSSRGRTPTTEPMFGPPGFSYVYFTYGMHHCMNVSCEPDGIGAAVLLRAGVVVEGVEAAQVRRPGSPQRDLARGPARLAAALAIERSWSGRDLLDPAGALRLADDGWRPGADTIVAGPRTGVRHGSRTPWRFWLDGVAEVSPHRRHAKAQR